MLSRCEGMWQDREKGGERMTVPFPKCEGIQGEFYLTVDDKLHEQVAPLSDDLPLSVYTQSYRHAAREHIPLHWHSDVQLTWV